ncbi:uncharacterized protein TNCV_3305221, partial [Trichonephila clavipes]
MEGRFAETTNQLANSWTNARSASRRQGVLWSFSDGLPTINFGDDKLTPMKRRGIMRSLHGHFQLEENTKMLQAPSQGKAMDCVALSPASSHFITDGQFTRFADWRFVHKARLNLVPLTGNKPWLPKEQRACRRCGKWDETLPHVLNHCTSYSAAWQLRHNAILARIRTAVTYKGTVITENQAVSPAKLRPDLVAEINGNIYIVDKTVPFENRKPSFQEAKQRKVEKYHHLISHFNNLGFQNGKVVPIVVGSLGAWDPENDTFLKQYSTENFVPHPDPVATTEVSNQPIEGDSSQGSSATTQPLNQDPQRHNTSEEAVTHSSPALTPTAQQKPEDVRDSNNETSPKTSETNTPPVNHHNNVSVSERWVLWRKSQIWLYCATLYHNNVNTSANATAPASQETRNNAT